MEILLFLGAIVTYFIFSSILDEHEKKQRSKLEKARFIERFELEGLKFLSESGVIDCYECELDAKQKLNKLREGWSLDLPPKNRTMTWMRFPVNLSKRESRYEEKAFYRRTDYWCDQRA